MKPGETILRLIYKSGEAPVLNLLIPLAAKLQAGIPGWALQLHLSAMFIWEVLVPKSSAWEVDWEAGVSLLAVVGEGRSSMQLVSPECHPTNPNYASNSCSPAYPESKLVAP